MRLNNLSNLHPCRMAVGSTHAEIDIYAATKDTFNKGTSSIHKNHDINETFVTEKIKVVPLNDHLKEDRKVSFIKIDVEGFEKDVLKGAWELIERDRPAIVFEHSDVNLETPLEVRQYISDKFHTLSYKIYFIRQVYNKFQYKFLELFEVGTVPFASGDFLALPHCIPLPSKISIHQ